MHHTSHTSWPGGLNDMLQKSLRIILSRYKDVLLYIHHLCAPPAKAVLEKVSLYIVIICRVCIKIILAFIVFIIIIFVREGATL
jgi:hypothetical protein